MKRSYAYWMCQVFGWGTYSLMGMVFAAQSVGWVPGVWGGYGLFFIYSVGLTHLLRRYIRTRGYAAGIERWWYLRILLAALTVGAVQAALVIGISFLFGGKAVLREAAMVTGTVTGVIGVTIGWTVLYVGITAGRDRQLAVREAELRALEAQINPHFLFNCLNSIRGLVVENPPLAQDLITRLANILRYNLHRDAGHTVPLAEELEAATDYLALEQARFEDRLRVRLAIGDDTRQLPVPPLVLQTLVENAIKHGIGPLQEGGEVIVRSGLADGVLTLEVENPGRVAEGDGNRKRLGLRNIRERLRMLYGGRASLELRERDGRVAATVRIPRV